MPFFILLIVTAFIFISETKAEDELYFGIGYTGLNVVFEDIQNDPSLNTSAPSLLS